MEADLQPHRSRYWLNAKTKAEDPEAFVEQVETICTLYAYARLLHALGVHIVSCDEMTGIQALERIAPTKPVRPGLVERREFEYKRHGTQSLIANFEIVTGAGHRPVAWADAHGGGLRAPYRPDDRLGP